MAHSTTLTRIVELSLAEQQLLGQTEWSDADHSRCVEIQASLAQLWPKRRAELVFERAGPPRLISAPDPRSQPQVRRFAHGVQPLPSGGD
jgi:hypothetical protein